MLLLSFFLLLLLFGVILLYSILFWTLIFIWHKFCLVVFIASKGHGSQWECLAFLKSFHSCLCFISDTQHSDAGQRLGPSSIDSKHHCRSSGRTHWSEKALQYTKRVLWSPCTHSLKKCVCAWYCTTLAKISPDVRECVWVCFVCIHFIFYWHRGVVGEALPASLVKLLVLCVQGKADWQTNWWHSCNAQPPFFTSNQFEVFSKNEKTVTNYYNNYYCY